MRIVRPLGLGASLVVVCASLAVACSTQVTRSGFSTDTSTTQPAPKKKGAGSFAGASSSGGDNVPTGECGVNNTGTGDPNKDYDGDGYTLKDDCNECNTSINAGAMDVPGNGIDEDCSGTADDETTTCDDGIDVETKDANQGAAAIGLCKQADPNGKGWGVLSAQWVKPDGTSLDDSRGWGVLPAFGVNSPHEGKAVLALSSGMARSPADPGFNPSMTTIKGYTSGTPAGYPKESPACPGVKSGASNDGASLQVKIRVPSNAQSFSYDHFFFTVEFPEYICSEYNDFFVTMMDPIPAGLPDGNIAFDQDTNPISVNNSLFQVCAPSLFTGGKFKCPLGTALLQDTGFENAGGTGWLTTSAPVAPGQEITLTFSIWDSGDGKLDSTVLVDNFKWSINSADTAQTAPSDVK